MVTTDEIGQDRTLTQIMTTDQSSTSSPIGTEHAVHQNTTDPSQPTGNPHENLPYKIIFVLSLVIILICCVFIVYFCRRGHRRESRSTGHASEYRVSKNEAMTSIGIDSRDLDCGGIRANQITIRTPSPRLYLPTCATAVETKASIHDSPVDGDDDDSQSKSDDEYYDMTKWYRTSDHAIHIDPVDEPKMSHVPMETSSGDGRHLGNALRPLGRTPSSRSDRLYDSIPSHGHKRHPLKHCYPTCHTSLRQGYSEWKVPDGELLDIPHYQNIRF
ncbi:uncharacterized protein LOC121419794 [Lytechinus variegatus]|uniref:uncharacterized protein LOC121419794 n=1 Tax=Lytechinus variegatus TaxID=7654 RepID=UPI001BB1A20C|nr:uncharacterized protein LOC121419794 [Lytechinus variegatus]